MIYLNPNLTHSDWKKELIEHRPKNRRFRHYSRELKLKGLSNDIRIFTYKKDELCYAIHYRGKLFGIVNRFDTFRYLGDEYKYKDSASVYPIRYCFVSKGQRIAVVKKGYEDSIFFNKKYVGSMKGLGITWSCSGKIKHCWRIVKKIYKRKRKRNRSYGLTFDVTIIPLPLAITLFMYNTRWYND